MDLSSGIPVCHDGATPMQPPSQPRFGENHAFWMHDERSGIQINGHINTSEDVGAYEKRIGKLSISFPDGRLYLLRETGGTSTAEQAASPSLSYRCVEPFRRWTCRFDGAMLDCTIGRAYMSAAPLDAYRVPVSFEIEAEMTAPAWQQGALTPGGLGPVTSFIGGERYEQLFRNTGVLRIGGQEFRIEGCGNRTHRWGSRFLEASVDAPRMLGHSWATAMFPSGVGFGYQTYPTAEGGILWSEGHILRDGRLKRAKVVRVPWLNTYWWGNEPLVIELHGEDGDRLVVTGTTISSVITQMLPGATPGEQIPIAQSAARFHHDDETVVNMLERSLRRSCIETGVGRPE